MKRGRESVRSTQRGVQEAEREAGLGRGAKPGRSHHSGACRSLSAARVNRCAPRARGLKWGEGRGGLRRVPAFEGGSFLGKVGLGAQKGGY